MIVSGNKVLQRATAGLTGVGSPRNWLMQMAIFRDASSTVGGGWLPARLPNILDASQFPGNDAGAKINSAISALPVIPVNGVNYPAGTVILDGLGGTPVWTTPVSITSPFVSLKGPGASPLQFNYTGGNGTAGAPIVLLSLRTGIVSTFQGQTISGFSFLGHGQSYVIATSIGDTIPFRLRDIEIFGFSGTASIGLWMNNITTYSEHYSLADLQIGKNAYDIRFSNWTGNFGSAIFPAVAPGTNSASFGYGTWSNVFLGTIPGNYGIYIDGNNGTNVPDVYHSSMEATIEETNGESGTGHTQNQSATIYLDTSDFGNAFPQSWKTLHIVITVRNTNNTYKILSVASDGKASWWTTTWGQTRTYPLRLSGTGVTSIWKIMPTSTTIPILS